MDEVMSGVQGTSEKAAIVRLDLLPMWMGVERSGTRSRGYGDQFGQNRPRLAGRKDGGVGQLSKSSAA